MEDNEQIVEKIRKLLALSQSNNPHEAALALIKAQKPLQEHNLSMAEVQVKEVQANNDKSSDIIERYKECNNFFDAIRTFLTDGL